jgi:GT2 family glycosyltransferase
MDSESDLLSVVVLNYNGKDVLENCLSSVLNSNHEHLEIIVVDNGSSDGSLEIAEQFANRDERIRVIKNNRNLGFVQGYNIGAMACHGKYVALLNNDTEVSHDWLKEPINLMNADPKIGLCEGKILTSVGRVSYPGFFNPLGGTRKDSEPDNGQYDKVHEIFSPIGVAPIIRKSLMEDVGLYDPAIWWIGDIEDLSWRVHLHGYKVVYSPGCVIHHLARLGRKWYPRRMRMEVAFHATKNTSLMLLKNTSLWTLLRYFPTMIALRAAELIYLSSTGNGDLFQTKVKAHLWILRNVGHISKYRSKVQDQMRRANDKEVLRLMCRPHLWETFRSYKAVVRSL